VPTDEERLDNAFPETDCSKITFEALFTLLNEVNVLKGEPEINRVQFQDWLKAKLPR
jgi:hypothetical protein